MQTAFSLARAALPRPARRRSTPTTLSSTTGRRSLLALPAAAALLLAASPALAYGGSANILSTDAGSGNPRYDALVAEMAARGAVPSVIEGSTYQKAQPPPKKGRCSTGREAACK